MADTTPPGGGQVQAAGGVVWRPGAGGRPEVLLVHRPKHEDWSFPKGKLDEGESHEQCALREVGEETGYVCILGRELPATRYADRRGRAKVVRYWEMTPASGSFSPNDEVDAIRWLPAPEARELLSYERDRAVLDAFLATDTAG